mgnify:CR=1 FL=1
MSFEAKKVSQFLNLMIELKKLEKLRVTIERRSKGMLKKVLCLGNF